MQRYVDLGIEKVQDTIHLIPPSISSMALTIVDGAQLRNPHLRLRFPIPITGAAILDLADAEASAFLFELSLPESLRSAARRRVFGDDPSFLSTKFSDESLAIAKAHEYLTSLADELKDDPIVISVLDGSSLRLLLEDEDDFAVLAEDIFIDLDTDDKGKVSKNQIPNALHHMGVDMGVPPISESGDLLNNLLKKHEAEGEQLLGQAQFAELLQLVLQDLADALSEKHYIVTRKIKVVNGVRLEKMLVNQELFQKETESMFQDFVSSADGENKVKLQAVFTARGLEIGLPPFRPNEAVAGLYDEVFSEVREQELSGELTINALQVIVRNIVSKLVVRFKADPMFVVMDS